MIDTFLNRSAVVNLIAGQLILYVLCVWPSTASAGWEGLRALAREAVARGALWGGAGHYENIRSDAAFAIDPQAPANAAIADLALAPRDAQGLVHFGADFLILRPADAARGNGTLI